VPRLASPSGGQVFALAGETANVPLRVLAADPDAGLRILLDGTPVLVETRAGELTRIQVGPGCHLLQALTNRGHAALLRFVVR